MSVIAEISPIIPPKRSASDVRGHLVLLLIALWIHSACGSRTDLSKAKHLLLRWEWGWAATETCLHGRIPRTLDAAVQIELAQLFRERDACTHWLLGDAETLPPITISDLDEKSREKRLEANENAINMWTALTANDITDDVSDGIVRLVDAVKQFQHVYSSELTESQLEAILELESARDGLRRLLGFQKTSGSNVIPTPVARLGKGLPPDHLIDGPQKLGDHWRLDYSSGRYSIARAEGGPAITPSMDWKYAGNLHTDDGAIVWFFKTPKETTEIYDWKAIKIYRLFANTHDVKEINNIAYVNESPNRLDVISQSGSAESRDDSIYDAEWRWFAPGARDTQYTTFNFRWASWFCSSQSYLWVGSCGEQNGARDCRAYRFIPNSSEPAPSIEGVDSGSPTCDDKSLFFASGPTRCTLETGCESSRRGMLIDGQIVSWLHGPPLKQRGQLFVLQIGKEELVFRLPPRVELVEIVKRKKRPIAVLTAGATHTEIELPWLPDPRATR